MKIHNYLDHLTIEEVAKYTATGLELIINDGHVQGMTTKTVPETFRPFDCSGYMVGTLRVLNGGKA